MQKKRISCEALYGVKNPFLSFRRSTKLVTFAFLLYLSSCNINIKSILLLGSWGGEILLIKPTSKIQNLSLIRKLLDKVIE